MPGHDLDGGYPFEPPISFKAYPGSKRIGRLMNIKDGKIMTDPYQLHEKIGTTENSTQQEFDTAFIFGVVERLIEADRYLQDAEMQIMDMLKDGPFIPETYGFEKTHGPEEIHDDPTKVYKSKYTTGVLLLRAPGEGHHDWYVLKDGVKTRFEFLCSRVAFHVLTAMGVQMKERNANEEIDKSIIDKF